MDLDEVLMVPKDSKKPKMSHEEQKAMLDGRVSYLTRCINHIVFRELTPPQNLQRGVCYY